MLKRDEQSGFTLLMFVILLLGIGGTVLAGYMQNISKQVTKSRIQHNKDVLDQAKRALLMYSYNYPRFNQEGPGRLPCPDVNNTGDPGGVGPLTIAQCTSVGRFPWNDPDMEFFDARDASNERLWYAVSDQFYNIGGGPNINSDSIGSITLVSQNGNIIYDGFVSGIAAVIIAPGPQINNQDRSVANGDDPEGIVADTDPGIVNAANYLDSFNGFDNSLFNNAESDTNDDGFILGPVFNPAQNSYVVNDQLVVITTEEVIEMAEKSVLDTYKGAIDTYQRNIWGGTAIANYRYPWLDDYSTTLLTNYDADIGTTIGRVPSLFANYFDDTIPVNSQVITSDIRIRVNVTVAGETLNTEETINTNSVVSFDTNGDLFINPSANGVDLVRYYWDEQGGPDGWEPCEAAVVQTPQHCNQAIANPGVPDSSIVPNEIPTRVLEITYELDFLNATVFTRDFSDINGAPVFQPPTGAEHAFIYVEFDENSDDEIDVGWVYDSNYNLSFDNVADDDDIPYSIGVTYYPVLPNWALAANNDWHDTVQASYAASYQPGAGGDCSVLPDCLTVDNSSGVSNNKAALLIIAGDHNMLDDDDNAIPIPSTPGFTDELDDIFDVENDDLDLTFDARAGNDRVLILREN